MRKSKEKTLRKVQVKSTAWGGSLKSNSTKGIFYLLQLVQVKRKTDLIIQTRIACQETSFSSVSNIQWNVPINDEQKTWITFVNGLTELAWNQRLLEDGHLEDDFAAKKIDDHPIFFLIKLDAFLSNKTVRFDDVAGVQFRSIWAELQRQPVTSHSRQNYFLDVLDQCHRGFIINRYMEILILRNIY